jgi:hypothetical protein
MLLLSAFGNCSQDAQLCRKVCYFRFIFENAFSLIMKCFVLKSLPFAIYCKFITLFVALQLAFGKCQ